MGADGLRVGGGGEDVRARAAPTELGFWDLLGMLSGRNGHYPIGHTVRLIRAMTMSNMCMSSRTFFCFQNVRMNLIIKDENVML